jgi:hypothetical protein
MKRFHVHVSVGDLAQSIRFYSTLFGSGPSVVKEDYAKWLLDDPRVNFAISRRGLTAGVDHPGVQVDSGQELAALEAQLRRADAGLVAEPNTTCCYARSDKYWVTDPQGVAWEAFHTLGSAPVFGESAAPRMATCCAPAEATAAWPAATGARTSTGCCR